MNQFNITKYSKLNEITSKAINIKLESLDPNLKHEFISEEEILKIIELLSNELKINLVTVIIGIYLLFLKGAANSTVCYFKY